MFVEHRLLASSVIIALALVALWFAVTSGHAEEDRRILSGHECVADGQPTRDAANAVLGDIRRRTNDYQTTWFDMPPESYHELLLISAQTLETNPICIDRLIGRVANFRIAQINGLIIDYLNARPQFQPQSAEMGELSAAKEVSCRVRYRCFR